MSALRDWWRRVTGPQPSTPSDDFKDAEDKVEEQGRRIAALELKVRVIETRLKAEDAATSYRKPA